MKKFVQLKPGVWLQCREKHPCAIGRVHAAVGSDQSAACKRRKVHPDSIISSLDSLDPILLIAPTT